MWASFVSRLAFARHMKKVLQTPLPARPPQFVRNTLFTQPITAAIDSSHFGVHVLHAPPRTGKPCAVNDIDVLDELRTSGKIVGCLSLDLRCLGDAMGIASRSPLSPARRGGYSVVRHAWHNIMINFSGALPRNADSIHALVSYSGASETKPAVVFIDHWDAVVKDSQNGYLWRCMVPSLNRACGIDRTKFFWWQMEKASQSTTCWF